MELNFISNFLQSAFISKSPSILFISGDNETGKTSAVQICCATSEFPDRIHTFSLPYEFKEACKASYYPDRHVLVFDNADTMPISEILNRFSGQDVSLILVSRTSADPGQISSFMASFIHFGLYSVSNMESIMHDKLGSYMSAIDPLAIHMAAHYIVENRGTIRDLEILLEKAISSALEQKLTCLGADVLLSVIQGP